MSRIKIICTVLAISIVFTLSACTRDTGDNNMDDNYNVEGTTIEMLSILIPDYLIQGHFRTAEETLNQELYGLNRKFELDIITFPHQDITNQVARMETMMMAGEMYDMFFLMPQHNLWRYSHSGFLVDMYTLIDKCMHVNREDFLTNVLNAFTIEGGLYAFPLDFNFYYMAISDTIPQDFVNRFYEMNTITPAELMTMFIDLQNRYPNDFNSMHIANPFSSLYPMHILERRLSDFVNISTGVSTLNSDNFVAFLDMLRHVHEMQGFVPEYHDVRTSGLLSPAERQRQSRQYMFVNDNYFLNSFFAYFEPSHQNFLHHIPLSNDNGELYISRFTSPNTFSVVATGNEALAWDYLRHLIAPMTVTTNYHQPLGAIWFSIPIKKSYFESNFLSVIYHSSHRLSLHFEGMDEDDNEREERIQRALDMHASFSEMPVASIPLIPIEIINEDLNLFMDGAITSEDAAMRMHNRISLWLIE